MTDPRIAVSQDLVMREVQRERDELHAEVERLYSERNDAVDELILLRDEIARLRAALKQAGEIAEFGAAETERVRAVIEAYLENDSQANWDALAALVEHKPPL